jgi:hypothetical protein
MKIASFALLAFLAVPAAMVPLVPATAQTGTDCAAQIASLRTAAEGVAISGKNADKDREGLIRNLDAATTELGKGKTADAAKKLADFKVKVEQLASAERISSGDAASLTAQADSAIACLNGPSAELAPAASEELLLAARDIA